MITEAQRLQLARHLEMMAQAVPPDDEYSQGFRDALELISETFKDPNQTAAKLVSEGSTDE